MDTERMGAALLRLEPAQRQLLRLAAEPGMTYRRVAERLGATPADVLRDLRLALSSLQAAV